MSVDLRVFGGSALTDDIAVPNPTNADRIGNTIPSTYVPARNTIFLALALGWAEVLEVNDIPTPNLQTFIDVVRDIGHRESVRLKTMTWNETLEVITLKLDNQYWPTYELRRTDDGWRRTDLGT